jgi:hypothetical protein
LSDKEYMDAVGLEEYFPNDMMLYPNPCKGKFWCELKNSIPNQNVQVTDIHGRIISKTVTQPGLNEIDLHVQPGVYIIEVPMEQGIQRKKIVVD